jgi:PiT family inorganic phosphate transporter
MTTEATYRMELKNINQIKKVYCKELVKRSALLKIAAAWVITVPASGLLYALIFYTIRGALFP